MTVSLDLHDLSLQNNNFYYLNLLRQQYPALKVSAFYVPADSQFPPLHELQRQSATQMIVQAVKDGWLELIPHGITHRFGEFKNATYEDMALTAKAYDEHFQSLGIPYVKGFCAPNWLLDKDAIRWLDEHHWFLAVDRNQPDSPRAKHTYEYTWDIAEPFPTGQTLVMGHGHISKPSANDLPSCLRNLIKIPHDAQWVFVSHLMKEAYADA